MARLDRFQRLALLTTLTTYALIAVGGLVRASGAGLGCPDWPRCFGLWIPPLDVAGLPPGFDPADFNVFKTWTEYINRLLGSLTGLLILATLALALVDHRASPRVLRSTTAAFVLVLFNGWLGGMVVRSQLAPLVLTAHMVGALLVVGCLVYATVEAFSPAGRAPEPSPERARLGWMAAAAAGLVLVQVGIGAFLRGEVQEVAERGVERELWLAHVGAVEIVHQTFAWAPAAAIALVAAEAVRIGERWTKRAAIASALIVTTQVASGLGLSHLGFPRALQVVHLWAAALLIGSLSVVGLLARRVHALSGLTPGGSDGGR